MRKSTLFVASGFLGLVSTSALARAGQPACPASLGGYVTKVTGNTVVICPTINPNPGTAAGGCPLFTGMDRLDEATGSTANIQDCVPAPDAGPGSAAINCYEDECVPPGTYQYAYRISPFMGCDGHCAGATSGEWATRVTVTSPLSDCTPSHGPDGQGGIAWWTDRDAGPLNQIPLSWSGTCCDTPPPPDGGSCAVVNNDCSVLWVPCLADGGAPCFGQNLYDGGLAQVECSDPVDAGGGKPEHLDSGSTEDATVAASAPDRSAGGLDGSVTAAPADTSGATPSGSGGCSVAQGARGEPFAPLVVLSLAGLWWRARRARAGKEG